MKSVRQDESGKPLKELHPVPYANGKGISEN